MRFTICVLPGDGIGKDVTAEAVKVLQAAGRRFKVEFDLQEALLGGVAIDATGSAFPPDTARLAKRADAVLLGAVGDPKYDDPTLKVRPEQGLLAIRKALGLYANLRPVKLHPALLGASTIRPEVLEGVDLMVVRELTGGLYFGRPSKRWVTPQGKRKAVDTMAYSDVEVERILRVGYELARTRRKKLTSVDKANVLTSSRLWREVAREVAKDYPDVQTEHQLVDSIAMALIKRPRDFDVMVTENTFGDILTDEASMLAGSMGLLASASLAGLPSSGRAKGLYEPIHGSAPKYTGRNVANPLATIMSVSLMLRYSCGLPAAADAIDEAVDATLSAGHRTPDLALNTGDGVKVVGTREMGDLVTQAVESGGRVPART